MHVFGRHDPRFRYEREGGYTVTFAVLNGFTRGDVGGGLHQLYVLPAFVGSYGVGIHNRSLPLDGDLTELYQWFCRPRAWPLQQVAGLGK